MKDNGVGSLAAVPQVEMDVAATVTSPFVTFWNPYLNDGKNHGVRIFPGFWWRFSCENQSIKIVPWKITLF